LETPVEGVAKKTSSPKRQARETPKPVGDGSAAPIQRYAVKSMHVRAGDRISLKHFSRKTKPLSKPCTQEDSPMKHCLISDVPSRAHQTSPYSRKLPNMYRRVAVLALLCTSVLAWSQQPHISKAGAPYATNTPPQVVLGSVTPIQAYDPASKLKLAISIKAPKMAEEERFLKQLQDRTSPNFHKWLTPEQWNARFAPAAEDEQAVVDWATSQGLTVIGRYPNRLMVNVEGTVDAIQKAFSININKYQVDGEVEFSNDRDPQFPSNLQGIIEFVDGLNSILRMRPANGALKGMRGPDYAPGPLHQIGQSFQISADPAAVKAIASKRKAAASRKQTNPPITSGAYDPTDIWNSNAYDYDALQAQGHCCNPLGNSGQTPPDTTIAVATDGDFADSDALGFHTQYPYLAEHYNRVFVNGTPSCCDDETTLDLEWSTATANSQGSYVDTSFVWVYEAAKGFGDFGTLFQQIANDNYVRVVNISYGLNETYLNGYGLVSSWHSIFNQMLGQGMTIMAAAGDNGATAGCGDSISLIYPGSDPDVVSVGGTAIQTSVYGFSSEVAWTGGTSSGSCSHNNGGTGGGCSALFSAPGYQSSPACGSGSRSVPDVALNAAVAQNYYFNGGLHGVGGTSISSPMTSGFIAQENAYLLYIGVGCGTDYGSVCSPVGEVNYSIYREGYNPGDAPHYPFYDITSGCNSNDITAAYGLSAYCAGTGYDLVTGWGTFNALQLSWAISSYYAGGYANPTITFSGPFSGANGNDHWYNSDQTVYFSVTANGNGTYPATGVAGYSAIWDNYISDPFSEPTPGSGNSFYSGPGAPNQAYGSLDLASAGQGCHFATVDAWDNTGFTPGEQFYYYICYDTVAPTSTISLSGTVDGSVYSSAVKVTLSASDASPGSGISATYYQLDGGAVQTYSAAFMVTATGEHVIAYYSRDVAGNYEATKSKTFWIKSPTVTVVTSSVQPSVFHQPVTFKATVTPSFGATPLGSVAFKNNGVVMGTVALSGGVASYTTSALTEGSHTIVAVYGTSGKDIASVSAGITQTVNKAKTTTTVTSSVNPSSWHQSVTFTATVHGAFGGVPTGIVTFKNAAGVLGTGALNASGVATLSTTALSVGVHSITIVYPGDTDFTASTSSPLAQTVNKAATTTTLISSLNPSNHGQAVTFTATIAPAFGGAVTGTVNFKDGSTIIGSGTVSAAKKATFTTSTLTVGTHPITAVYQASTNLKSSFSTAVKQVVK
jgi:hypothetical protein